MDNDTSGSEAEAYRRSVLVVFNIVAFVPCKLMALKFYHTLAQYAASGSIVQFHGPPAGTHLHPSGTVWLAISVSLNPATIRALSNVKRVACSCFHKRNDTPNFLITASRGDNLVRSSRQSLSCSYGFIYRVACMPVFVHASGPSNALDMSVKEPNQSPSRSRIMYKELEPPLAHQGSVIVSETPRAKVRILKTFQLSFWRVDGASTRPMTANSQRSGKAPMLYSSWRVLASLAPWRSLSPE